MNAESLAPLLTLEQVEAEHDALLLRRDTFAQPLDGTPEFWADVERFLAQARHSGIQLDRPSDRRSTQGLLDYWASALVRAGQPVPDLQLEPSQARDLPDLPCPYQGLEAFSEERGAYFFGRDSYVDDMLRRLQAGQRLFVVAGASGSGKSSLIRAGLIPRLRAGALPESASWRYVAIVPGRDPVQSLAKALHTSELGPQAFSHAEDASGNGQPDRTFPIVLLVDQFEEVFTLSAGQERQTAFVGQIFDLLRTPDSRHLVFLTVRNDYVDELRKLPSQYSIQICHKDNRVSVEALSLDELRAAIECPAEKVGLRFEEGIIEDLAGKALGQTAGLPLLQFTLLRLWERREHNCITRTTYADVGDPLCSLQKCAEGFYGSLIGQSQKLVQQIFTQKLIRLEPNKEATSQRIQLREVIFKLADPAPAENVADLLAQMIFRERLVKLTGVRPRTDMELAGGLAHELLDCANQQNHDVVAQVEVAHEALIRNWTRLDNWLRIRRQQLENRYRWDGRAAAWIRMGRGEGGLLDAVELGEAERWLQSDEAVDVGHNPEVKALVAESRSAIIQADCAQKAARQRVQRWQWAFAALFILLVATWALMMYRSLRESKFETAELLTARSDQLVNLNPDLALLLAVEAADKTFENRWPPLDTVLQIQPPDAVLRSLQDNVNSRTPFTLTSGEGDISPHLVAISPDRILVAAVSEIESADPRCAIHLWRVIAIGTNKPASQEKRIVIPCAEPAYALYFAPDSSMLAVVHEDGAAEFLHLDAQHNNQPSLPLRIERDTGQPLTGYHPLVFSPTWRWLLAKNIRGGAALLALDWKNGSAVLSQSLPDSADAITTAVFSPDERWLVTANVSGALQLWTLGENPGQQPIALPRKGEMIAFSSDSRWLSVGSKLSPDVYLRDLQSTNTAYEGYLAYSAYRDSGVTSLAFQPEQAETTETGLLGAGYDNGIILLWDTHTLQADDTSKTPPVSLQGLSPADSGIPTPEFKVSLDLISVAQPTKTLYEHLGPVDQLVFNPHTPEQFISVSADGIARIWKLSEGPPQLMGSLYSREHEFQSVWYGGDGLEPILAVEGYTLQQWPGESMPKEAERLIEIACTRAGRSLNSLEEQAHLGEDTTYRSACERYFVAEEEGTPQMEATK